MPAVAGWPAFFMGELFQSWGLPSAGIVQNRFPCTSPDFGKAQRIITPSTFSSGILVKFFSLIDSGRKTYFLSYTCPSM